jgi:hypothetical protein
VSGKTIWNMEKETSITVNIPKLIKDIFRMGWDMEKGLIYTEPEIYLRATGFRIKNKVKAW